MKAVIHLEEILNFKADAKSKVISTESSGLLKVINPSNNTTLWGIKLDASNEADVLTEIQDTIQHIEAGKDYVKEYKTSLSSQLVVTEIVDTNFNGEEINELNRDLTFDVDQNLAFMIKIENNYDFPIKNISVEKYFPQIRKIYELLSLIQEKQQCLKMKK